MSTVHSKCQVIFNKFIYLLIFWLCWVFVSVQGLSPVAASGGHSSSRCAGLLLSRPLLLRSTGSRRAGSVAVAHGLSCSAVCGIFPDQGSNPRPLHWQADSQPLRHQGSPVPSYLMDGGWWQVCDAWQCDRTARGTWNHLCLTMGHQSQFCSFWDSLEIIKFSSRKKMNKCKARINVRPDTIKLLEENIGRTLYGINHSKILFGPPPREMEIKTKINKWDPMK